MYIFEFTMFSGRRRNAWPYLKAPDQQAQIKTPTPLEHCFYRLAGVKAVHEQDWKGGRPQTGRQIESLRERGGGLTTPCKSPSLSGTATNSAAQFTPRPARAIDELVAKGVPSMGRG